MHCAFFSNLDSTFVRSVIPEGEVIVIGMIIIFEDESFILI